MSSTERDPNAPHSTSRTKGFIAAGAVVICWSGFNIVSRMGGRSTLTPFDLAALRFGISALILSPFLLTTRFIATPFQLAVLALFGGLAYGLLVYAGFSLAPAAHAGILVNGGIPFATALIAWLALGYRPGTRAVISLAIAGLGIALIGYRSVSNAQAGEAHQWLGDLFFLAAAVCQAIFGLLLRKWKVRPLEAMMGLALISAPVYLPIYWLFLPKALMSAPASMLLLQGIYQGVIAATVAGMLYAYANLTIGPMKASLMLALVPAASALAAGPLLDEQIGFITWFGVALVTGGAVLGATNPKK
jgi:drug/metabolite transporter (DMT)-like permease